MSTEEKGGLDIALEIKLEHVKRIRQISLLAQVYCDNKKILKYLKKIVICEEKRFKGSRFSVTEAALGEIAELLGDCKSVIQGLIAADTTEEFNRAKKGMEAHLEALEEALKPTVADLAQNIKGVFEKAKSKVRSLKNAAIEGLERIKNGVCDEKDEDSESV
ncbi:MAG: hypothetical protein IJ514_06425 [Clostridia bacterium]|nr:hypothetical protein [Clostridia bacterium]